MAESRQRGSSQNGKQSGKRNGASPANRNAEKPDQALLRADSFTNAPKVSRSKLTKEEREEITKQQEAERKEAEKLDKVAARGPIGRWWCKLQSSPDKVSLGMAIVALGVVYGDIGTSPLYTAQTFLSGQGGLANTGREAVLGMLSIVFCSITLITSV